MKITLLDAKTLGADLDLSPLEAFGELEVYETTTPAQTLERIKDSYIIITNKVVITDEIMAGCEKLALICVAATGTNNIDLNAARERGIPVKNVAGYSTQSVVQHTFAMALYMIEKMGYYDGVTRSGEWSRGDIFTDISHPFMEICGKRWGIIGLGTIGREVAKVASAFGAEVCYTSTSGVLREEAYPHMELNELLSSCDIVSIHAPLNDVTNNLINSTNLPLFKDGALLLNLGRGGIVNESDLAAELEKRELYAALDVTAKEPIALDNPLMHITHKERLMITPHIAWASKEARVKLLEGIMKNIREFQNG